MEHKYLKKQQKHRRQPPQDAAEGPPGAGNRDEQGQPDTAPRRQGAAALKNSSPK